MNIPCRECITYAVCRQKETIDCIRVDDYAFLHDHDPGYRGARVRARAAANELFGEGNYAFSIDSINLTVWIAVTSVKKLYGLRQ